MATSAEKPGGTEPLPPLQQGWVDALLSGPIPSESRATCHDCAMCSPAAPAGDATHFNPRTKCCTYLPRLANFLVGRVLLDEGPANAHGRATVRDRIRKPSAAVSPLGLGWPRAYTLLHEGLWKIYDQRGSSHFGRADTLKCPHYVDETGGCGIWRHREATCAIWFCKHVRGATGQRFWTELKGLLSAVEAALARWCLAELDPGNDGWRTLAPPREHAPPGSPDARREYDAAWGSWLGREEALYVACAQRVETLAWSEVLAIGGAEIEGLARRAREAHALLLSSELPTVVHVSERALFRKKSDSGSVVRVPTYSEYDSLDLPGSLADVLDQFDGRPTREILSALAEDGTPIDDTTARRLVDFEVLVAGAKPRASE